MERVTLSSDSLRVEVIPEYGGKISSLQTFPEKEELLQLPLRPYAARSRTMAFEEGDASGIDECIPTVSGCEIVDAERKLAVPDHGDFWRIPFVTRHEHGQLVLDAVGFTFQLAFEKRLKLDGNTLSISYRLANMGEAEVLFLWSAHPGFAVEAGDRIDLPGVEEVAVWHSGGSRLGAQGTVHPWPHTTDTHGNAIDLSLVGAADAGVGDKLFANAPANTPANIPKDGCVALHRVRIKRRVEVHFDQAQAPYIGLWLAYGGWPERQTSRQHCVALEPCTAPVDSLAAAIDSGSARTLAAGAVWEWKIAIRVVAA